MSRIPTVFLIGSLFLLGGVALAQDSGDMNARFENLRSIKQFGRSTDAATMRETLFAVMPAEVVAYNKVPGKARSFFEHGNEALQNRQYQKAKEQYESALGIYPEFALAHHNLAIAVLGLSDAQRAEEELKAAIKSDPQMASAYLNLAVLQINGKDPGAAMENLQMANRLDPKDLKTLTLLAYCQVATQHLAEGIATAQRVHDFKNHAGYAYSHMIAGAALESLGQKEEAIKQYKQFIAEDPKDPRTAQAKQQLQALQQAH